MSDDKLPNVVQDKHETPNNWLKFNLEIKEGRNLPLITSKDRREPPVTYVSISNGLKHFTSDLVKKSCHPQWNFQGLQFYNIVIFCVFYHFLFIFLDKFNFGMLKYSWLKASWAKFLSKFIHIRFWYKDWTKIKIHSWGLYTF